MRCPVSDTPPCPVARQRVEAGSPHVRRPGSSHGRGFDTCFRRSSVDMKGACARSDPGLGAFDRRLGLARGPARRAVPAERGHRSVRPESGFGADAAAGPTAAAR